MKNIILASKSPRRRQLLEMVVPFFAVVTKEVDETILQGTSPWDAVMELACKKAEIMTIKENEIIISADTIVVLNEKIMGKPRDEEDAFAMLTQLSGNCHSVFTGMCIMSHKKKITTYNETRVFFRNLKDEEILSYIKTKEPMDKAGAYGIQGLGGLFVEKIEGDYYNVMGLPICRLCELLKNEFMVETTL